MSNNPLSFMESEKVGYSDVIDKVLNKSLIKEDTKISGNYEEELKEYNLQDSLDVFDLLLEPKDSKEVIKAILRKNVNTEYVINCIQYCIIIRPQYTCILLKILSFFAAKNGINNPLDGYLMTLLIHAGIIQGSPSTMQFSDIVNIYPEGSIERIIKDDDIVEFTKIINNRSFVPTRTIKIKKGDLLFNVEADYFDFTNEYDPILIDYMQLIVFFGSVKCFNAALSMKTFDLSKTAKFAVAGGNKEIIHALEENGISFDNCFGVSIKYNRYEISDWLLKHYVCENIRLSSIVRYFNLRAFFFMLNNGINKTKKSITTSFQAAAKISHLNLMRYLARKQHASVDDTHDKPDKRRAGNTMIFIVTALDNACWLGNIEVVKCLIEEFHAIINENGVHDCISGKITTLQLAVRRGHIDVVKYLVEKCYQSANAISYLSGQTAFHIAVRAKHLDIIKYLVEECNADPNIKDEGGYKPTDYIKDDKYNEIGEYLISKFPEQMI